MRQIFYAAFSVLFFGPLSACHKKAKADKKKPIEVFAVEAVASEIFDAVVFAGFIKAKDQRVVGSEVAGSIASIKVRLGDKVSKGQVLFVVRPLGLGLDYRLHTVTSPINGVLATLSSEPGKNVQPGETVLVVANPEALEVEAQLAYEDLFHIDRSQPLELVVGQGTANENSVQARVIAVAPAADTQTGSFPITLALDCATVRQGSCQESFRLGVLARGVLKKNRHQGVKVPLKALHSQRRKVLSIGKKNAVTWVDVKLGAYYGDEVEILEGVKPGAKLVTSFTRRPIDGEPVVIKVEDQEKQLIFSKGDAVDGKQKSH